LDDGEFWSAIEASVGADGWKLLKTTDKYREYESVERQTPEAALYALRVRVSKCPRSTEVIVACVHVLADSANNGFPSSGATARYVESTLWPRFDEAVLEYCVLSKSGGAQTSGDER
jgi:hypothetical protein